MKSQSPLTKIDILGSREETIEHQSSQKSVAVAVEQVDFAYPSSSQYEQKVNAVQDVSFDVPSGQHIVILGRNGSGKSTLAKLINGLLLPNHGQVIVFQKNTADENLIWQIRQSCGMVFQNPDNQIVGTTVEEDVAFGPENLGVPSAEIRQRVDAALSEVGLSSYALKSPSQLSGGQKQKLAIAGILAMQPKCIILDEATSMLDPRAGSDLMALIKELQQNFGLTIIDITHDIEKAMAADYIHVMKKGKIFFSGTPREIFGSAEKIYEAGLTLPQHLRIFRDFSGYFPEPTVHEVKDLFGQGIFTKAETAAAINELLQEADQIPDPIHPDPVETPIDCTHAQTSSKPVITFSNVGYTYQKNTDLQNRALEKIDFSIYEGELISVIGHSGSGKSTLISHINGLIKPQEGQVRVFGLDPAEKSDLREIRRHVGLLFQYPEHQLFENTVYEDIAFGPKQFGLNEDLIQKNIEKAIKIVGVDRKLLSRSPFELSGGQQRRVAIAGVIAMDCEVYVLDEPAAGLDPIGQAEIFHYIEELKELGKTIILVTHDMNLAAEISDRVLVLKDGRIVGYDRVEKIFGNAALLKESGLEEPAAYTFSRRLKESLKRDISGFSVAEVVQDLLRSAKLKAGDKYG